MLAYDWHCGPSIWRTARKTWFTHIAHELGHDETNRSLPDDVRLAYDGLTLEVELERENGEATALHPDRAATNPVRVVS